MGCADVDEVARFSAMLETGFDLATFSEEYPFTLAQTMDTEFLPDKKGLIE